MKTLFMMIFMGFAFILPTENTSDVSTLEKTDHTSKYELGQARTTTGYVRFGRQRRNCTGFGICTIIISTTNTNNGTRTTFGIDRDRLIYFRWRRSDVSKSDQSKYMRDGVLVIEEDVSETLEADGEKFQVNLKAGKYQLKEDKEGFLLEVSG